MTRDEIVNLLISSNETLSAAIVIITAAILLYNLTRNVRDRVNRSSSILLGSVTISYLADSFIALEPSQATLANWFRFQWAGVAFMPAAIFHLSDALLATTGLISRHKRRWVTRILYASALLFTVGAFFTGLIIDDLHREPVWHMTPGPLFPIYLLYFVLAAIGAMYNVVRAWQRCLTTHTRRRMTLLVLVFLTPAWGIFPYSLLLSWIFGGIGTLPEGWLWLIFNIANIFVLFMIAFMAYPLAFFGAYKPDRIVRAEFVEFMLRGPLTGVIVLVVIRSFPGITEFLGLPGNDLMPFAAVGAVLFLHWMITLNLPALENLLVYTSDQQQAQRLRQISDRLLTRADSKQLQEAILAAICDQLRVPTAFIASIHPGGKSQLEQVVGNIPGHERDNPQKLIHQAVTDNDPLNLSPASVSQHGDFFRWESYWIRTLHLPSGVMDAALEDADSMVAEHAPLLGILGIWSQSDTLELEEEEAYLFDALARRASYVLMDMQMQGRLLEGLEGLLIETQSQPARQAASAVSPYGQLAVSNGKINGKLSATDSIIDSPAFTELVKDALRDYWGGPKLAESELLKLNVVNNAAQHDEGNRVRALRRVLSDAIESLKPEGQQNLTTTEWILYNILEMRFLQGRKVRDVAQRLAMSQSDLYRKQRVAIEEVARIIAESEQRLVEDALQEDASEPGDEIWSQDNLSNP